MSLEIYDIICGQCNEGKFFQVEGKKICKVCGHEMTKEEIAGILSTVFKENRKWCYGLNEKGKFCDSLDEKCEAIEKGIELAKLEGVDSFYIGRVGKEFAEDIEKIEKDWTYEYCNRDIWTTGIWFFTKEEAIRAGKIMAKNEGVVTFEVGQKLEISMPGIDTDWLLERISESVYDEVGEAAETYLEDVKKEHRDELEEKLNEVLFDWAKKYGYQPTCWKVVNIETMTL
ncbi:hypothetical protein F8154_05850 [Alkaliphilus pronyensis]|uniref:Uncharacterized protein n=1 Tax=Alkaliphilus pronyensis TaxID=1482732 RepID=A0A6I0FA30_9FIRM|nr:TFIIB-type zinc finger domain-containing protein [Alkaliphilus pronyensis]KAB3535654.1 hypothetical protein F8154_05850 [Alkaliphilus pronyensis]